MSHEQEEDDIIILSSITLPAECNPTLDNFVENGAYGSTREEVARHFICRHLGVDPRLVLPDAPPLVVEPPPVDAEDLPTPETAEGDSGESAK